MAPGKPRALWREPINPLPQFTRQHLTQQARLFRAKKRLGQNFLIDPDVLADIAHTLDILPDDQVVEIGPGLGFLTNYLLQAGACVTAVELDRECVTDLSTRKLSGLNVVHGDFLQFDLQRIPGVFSAVGNVPYQITTPILAYLLGELDEPSPWLTRIKKIVLTVQYEVAERLTARPGGRNYSQITLLASYYADTRMVRAVDNTCFFPVPDVTSAVVELVPLPQPRVSSRNPRLLRQIIKAGFRQRRKMLKNNLAFTRLPQDRLAHIFAAHKIDPQTRAEGLSLEQFARLTDVLEQEMKPQFEE